MKPIYTLSQTPIIITDLDGTILVDGKLDNKVINTFKKIQSMGIGITFSTGRSKIPASKYAELLNLKIPYICSGGAIITDPESGLDLYHNEIEKNIYKDILNYVKKINKLNLAVYSMEEIYVEKKFKWIDDYCKRQSINIFKTNDLDSIKFRTVMLLIGSVNLTNEVTIELKKDYGDIVAINKTFDNLCEISSLSGNKLSSANVLLELLGLSKKDLMYFGDGEADIDLLEFANFGFTVKNSVTYKKLMHLNSIDEPEKNGFSTYINSII